MSYEAHLQKIKEAKNDNKLVFFIGSGMSKNVGLPDWSELINELKKDLNTYEQDFLKVAQLYFLEFGEYEYIKKIKSYFPLETINTQNIHQLLIKIFPQHIITTNWDTVIEKAIDDEMALYDIVRNDRELINTSSTRKLIKMHGDIEIGNIVFKEDDYLEYSQKFPLIENYVKSILSTNTVMFLGYSYNDINLKYITKWIQNSSKVRPPAYMVVFKEDKIQEKYFNNHGISVLNISNKYSLTHLSSEKEKKTLEIEYFLKDILTASNNFANVHDELELVDAFYGLFQDFEQFDIVLIDQLTKLLKNKSIKFRIDYDNSERTVLYLQDYYLLIDNLFKNFKTIFAKDSLKIFKKVKFIIRTLHRCGILGIGINTSRYFYFEERKYILKDYFFNIEVSCEISSKNAYDLAHNADYEQAYSMYKKLIASSKRTKKYIDMFFSMYNSNIVLRILKAHNLYVDDDPYDIDQKFLELKQSIREQLEPLLFMVRDESFLYKYMYDVKIFHENRQKQAKSIQNGRMPLSNNETEARQKHKNLLYFVNNNYLCVDIYVDFKNLQIEYIKTTLTRQFREETKTLDNFELYTCIKYIDKNDLKDIFDYLFDKTSIDYKKFELNDINRKYLQKLLEELTLQLSNISNRDQIQKFETYWKNTLYLLSLSAYPNIENLIDLFSRVLRIRGSIDIYREINLFFQIQKYVFDVVLKNDTLYPLLETVINKILSSNYDVWDVFALERNELFKYVIDNNEEDKYSNLELINSLLKTLKNFDDKTQVKISNFFLLSIYNFSNESIKSSIKEYVSQIDLEEFELMDIVEFKLLLLTRDIINIDDFDFENKIMECIKPYEDGTKFTGNLYQINDLVQHLIKVKNFEQLKEVQAKVMRVITQFEDLKSW